MAPGEASVSAMGKPDGAVDEVLIGRLVGASGATATVGSSDSGRSDSGSGAWVTAVEMSVVLPAGDCRAASISVAVV